MEGNATCTDVDGDPETVGVEIEPPKSGPFPLDNASAGSPSRQRRPPAVLTPSRRPPFDPEGQVFDQNSTLGVDAVIVKGGPHSIPYVYDLPSESTGDTGLHGRITAAVVSRTSANILFCFDYEFEVAKTAATSSRRTWKWAIDKTATPAKWDSFRGDTDTSSYKVDVTKTGHTDSDWAATGKMTVRTPRRSR